MADIKVPENTEELLKQCNDQFEFIRRKRSSYEQTWYTNLSFFEGMQWVQYYSDLRSLIPTYSPTQKVRHTSNLIAPNVRLMKSYILGTEPTIHAYSRKLKDNLSIETGELNNKVLQYAWYKHELFNSLQRVYDGTLIKGDAYWKLFWNPKKGKTVRYHDYQTENNGQPYMDEASGERTFDENHQPLFYKLDEKGNKSQPKFCKTGEFECAICEVDSVYVDPFATDDDNATYYFHTYVTNKQKVKEIWGKDIDPKKDLMMTGFDYQMDSLTGKVRELVMKDGVRITEKWEAPTETYPQGRLIVWANDKILQFTEIPDEYLDAGTFHPFVRFKFISRPNTYYSKSTITDARDPQKTINVLISKYIEHANLMSAGKWIAADMAKIPKGYITAQTGQVIRWKYGPWGPPTQAVLAQMPGYLLQLLEELRRDLNDVMFLHEPSHGRSPKGIKSGAALAALQEADMSAMGQIVDSMKLSLAHAGRIILSLYRHHTDFPTVIGIVGKDKKYYVEEFMGEEIDPDSEVVVEMDTSLPMNKIYRAETIRQDYLAGLLDRREARKLREIDEDVTITDERKDEAMQMYENELMEEGITVQVQPYDKPLEHMRVVRNRMEQPDFNNLPEKVKRLFMLHYMSHDEYLTKGLVPSDIKLDLQQMLAGGAPPPKKGQPQGPKHAAITSQKAPPSPTAK